MSTVNYTGRRQAHGTDLNQFLEKALRDVPINGRHRATAIDTGGKHAATDTKETPATK